MTDPFAALGLDADASLSDDDVRAAWRRVAEATHPDRSDGGDPARFAVAAAAYTELRTAFGRGEARAAFAERTQATASSRRNRHPAGRHLPARSLAMRSLATRSLAMRSLARSLAGRLRSGRPGRLALRLGVAAAAAAIGVAAAGPGPAGPALAVGAATWLLLTARRDLGPPAPRRATGTAAEGSRDRVA